MVNLILISTTLWRNWKRFFLFFYRVCSLSLSQHPFCPSVRLLAEDRAPRLHAAGLRGHVGTSLTALCRPQRRHASFRGDCGAVSPASRWTRHPGRLLGWCEWTVWKKQRERRKKKTQSLKQPIKESASGEVMWSPFWISYTVNLSLFLWLYWMWGLLASTSSAVEGGISNKQIYKKVNEWTKNLSGMALGQVAGWNKRLELQVCLNAPVLLVPLSFLPGWKVGKRGRLMEGEDSSSPLRKY